MRARLIGSFLLLVALAFPVLAQDRRGGPSLDRVLPQIARTVPGTFSDAEGPFISADGRATYHIKWMAPDGRIMWFTVDARTGQMMGSAPQFRNNDYSDRGERRNNWGDDRRNNWDDDRDGSHGWNQDGRGGDRGGDRRDWNQGNGRNRDGDRSGNRRHDWNQGGGDRGNRGGDRGNRGNDRGSRGNDRDRGDRRHGG